MLCFVSVLNSVSFINIITCFVIINIVIILDIIIIDILERFSSAIPCHKWTPIPLFAIWKRVGGGGADYYYYFKKLQITFTVSDTFFVLPSVCFLDA